MAKIASSSDDGLVTLWHLDGPNMKIPAWEVHFEIARFWNIFCAARDLGCRMYDMLDILLHVCHDSFICPMTHSCVP